MWWLHTKSVIPFVTFVNTSKADIPAHILISGGNADSAKSEDIVVGGGQTQVVKLDRLIQALPVQSDVGGVQVSYIGKPGTLVIEGGQEDFNVGYSSSIPFMTLEYRQVRKMVVPTSVTFAAVGVQVGVPEARMQFPQDTTFLTNSKGRRTLMGTKAHVSIFNVETATCKEPCEDCDNVVSAILTPPNGNLSVGANLGYVVTAKMKNGQTFNANGSTTFSSSNTGIATITSGGTALGINVGSATISARDEDTGNPSWAPGSLCNFPIPSCPVFIATPTAPINVQIPHELFVLGDISMSLNCPFANIYSTRNHLSNFGYQLNSNAFRDSYPRKRAGYDQFLQQQYRTDGTRLRTKFLVCTQ